MESGQRLTVRDGGHKSQVRFKTLIHIHPDRLIIAVGWGSREMTGDGLELSRFHKLIQIRSSGIGPGPETSDQKGYGKDASETTSFRERAGWKGRLLRQVLSNSTVRVDGQDWRRSVDNKGRPGNWMESWFAGAIICPHTFIKRRPMTPRVSFFCAKTIRSVMFDLGNKGEIPSDFAIIHAVADQPAPVHLKAVIFYRKIDQLPVRIIKKRAHF